MYLLSLDESYFLDNETDNDGSESESSGTCSFPAFSLTFEDFVGRVSVLWSVIFVPTGEDSKCDVFEFFVFVAIVVKQKGGLLLETIWLSNYFFSFKI